MNIKLNPELEAQLAAEQAAEATKSIVDKVTESANTIRENLVAVKGEDYARLIEIGVLVHKRSQLMSAVLAFAADAGAPKTVRKVIASLDASLSAHVLQHAAIIMNKEADEAYAKEMTEWIDRIADAEQAGVESVKDELFGDDTDED